MKIGFFSDPHYCRAEVLCGTRRPSLSLAKIREAMEAFKKANVDICVCLGDLTDHSPGDSKDAVKKCFFEATDLIKSYGIPLHLVPGNHDYLATSGDDLAAAGIKIPPYTVTVGGYRLIFLDANYRSDGRRFDEGDFDWTDSNLPQYQCEFLKAALSPTKKNVVCIHENLDPFVESRHIVKNAAEIREIIKGRAAAVFQGHYHPGAEHVVDDIPYITLHAACEGTTNAFRVVTLD